MCKAWIVMVCVGVGTGLLSADTYLEFDGDDYVLVNEPVGLSPTEVTLESMVNFGRIATGDGYSSTDSQFIVSKGNEQNEGTYRLTQGSMDGDPALVWAVGQPYRSNRIKVAFPLEADRWYHLAGTYDGTALKLYVDGELVDENVIGSVVVGNSDPLYLGYNALSGWEYFLTGGLDEVRIWDHAREQADIRRDMGVALTGAEPGLIGYWDFEEEQSSQWALDLTGGQNDAQLGALPDPDPADPTRVPEPTLLSILAAGALVALKRRR